ncbi:hypothetical protein EXU30_14980 [Shewanella maritima]|uniref:Uncharacterized protein n=1 Tax=Shewanella maritima TaxID=2520507 RepID=A0A411PJT8_9GAMM|nr:hypothetical protein [Shewanella maritima]QBF83836.1 hypothetical protein EXU30_14980 [Shewanella maritima]
MPILPGSFATTPDNSADKVRTGFSAANGRTAKEQAWDEFLEYNQEGSSLKSHFDAFKAIYTRGELNLTFDYKNTIQCKADSYKGARKNCWKLDGKLYFITSDKNIRAYMENPTTEVINYDSPNSRHATFGQGLTMPPFILTIYWNMESVVA